jgi:hypothetical protein
MPCPLLTKCFAQAIADRLLMRRYLRIRGFQRTAFRYRLNCALRPARRTESPFSQSVSPALTKLGEVISSSVIHLVVLHEVLVADKFLFSNDGAEAVLFQERVILMNTGTEVIDFAMQHDPHIQSPYTTHCVPREDYRSSGCFAKIGSALSLIRSHEAVSKLASPIEETLSASDRPSVRRLRKNITGSA